MISDDVKNLFKQYSYNKNILAEDAAEIEKVIRAFTESLTHDLIRALYLNNLTDDPVDFPDPIKAIQLLLQQFAVEDPYLKNLRDRPFALGDDLQELLNVERQCYSLIQDPIIQELLNNPTENGFNQAVKGFDLAEWEKRVKHVESLTHFDHVYDEDLKRFLQCMKDGKNDGPVPAESQKLLDAIFPVAYRLVRRGEVGLQLIDLVLQGRFSYLCFVQIIATKGDKFDEALKTGMVISRLDMLHEFQFLSTKLFLLLRKQGIRNITKELENRTSLVQLMMDLYQQKWIAPKQIESILKTSQSQQVAPLLATLEKFSIKKEVSLIRVKIKGAEQEVKMANQLSELSTSVKVLHSFWRELLQKKSWQEREPELTITEIADLLKKYVKQVPARPSNQTSAVKTFQQTLSKSQQTLMPTNPEERPPAKQKSSVAEPMPFARKVESLQQQLNKAFEVQKEIIGSADGAQDAVDLLGERSLLFSETVHAYQQKLTLLQQKWEQKKLSAQDHPEKLLDKWEEEIQQNIKVDTEAFKLLETLKKYEADWELTIEELSEIKNVNKPYSQRKLWVEKCFQKYALLNELQKTAADKSRLSALHYETASPLLFHVVQDILKKDPFYFEGNALSALKKVCPGPETDQLESSRKLVNTCFEIPIGSDLLIHLVGWGILLIAPEKQEEIKKGLLAAKTSHQSIDWDDLTSSPVSPGLIQKILKLISEPALASMDQEGKDIVAKFKEMLTQSDETSIEQSSEDRVEYLVNSLRVTEHVLRVQRLVEAFQKIENAVKDPEVFNTSSLPRPSKIAERFFQILELDDYEQRLELLIEQTISIFSERDPLVQSGKKLYQDVIGFEF
ncbi:MAG: hypothetical protein HQM14_05030 [SAR324 cluster bacterium]|nr:hypothetical protein [SAR324 cluster bacterium]